MNSKVFGLLGIARRAGRLSMGHDMAMESLMKGKAKLVIITSDASQRLVEEFKRAASFKSNKTIITVANAAMDDIHAAVGYKAKVLSVDDDGFAQRILQLINEGDNNL